MLLVDHMTRSNGVTFVDQLLKRVPARAKEGLSIKLNAEEGYITVCIGPSMSRKTRELLGMEGPRAIHIEGVFRGRQFVIDDPSGMGRLGPGSFCGLDVDPTGFSMQQYIGMGADEFYAMIQAKILQNIM